MSKIERRYTDLNMKETVKDKENTQPSNQADTTSAQSGAGDNPVNEQNLPVLLEQATNLNTLLDTSCQRYATQNAIGMAQEKPLTYQELHDRVLLLAALLRDSGVQFGDRVSILAENSHNWGTVYFAIVRLGATCVPILPDLPEADVHHILTEMECDILFTTQRQVEKVYDLQVDIKQVITLDDYTESSEIIEVTTFSNFLSAAQTKFSDDLKTGALEFPEVESDHIASILYTSGTSGFSKAVMLSHGNLCANGFSTCDAIKLPPEAVFLSVLPVSHTYEFTTGFIMPLIKGAAVYYAGKTPTPMVLQKLCASVRPHVMLVVPLIMEKIYKKRVLPAVEKSKMLTLICRFSLGRKLIYRKIGGKLEKFFGGRLVTIGIGGAALNPEVENFLRDANFPFLIGYGLTEASPLIAGGPNGEPTIRTGSAGKLVTGVEVRIDNPAPETGIGEILARGPNIMQGYWNDPEETNKNITDDGWLRTGDLGFMDDHDNLHIKGRSKSVIVLANGENVYPEAIEHKLNAYPFVIESIVIENHAMLEAWIYPDYDFIDALTQGQSRQQRHEYIETELNRIRKEVNEQVSALSRLSRVLERREPFIKTATHKIKRYLYTADSMVI